MKHAVDNTATRRCYHCHRHVPLRPGAHGTPRLIRHGDKGKPECPAGGKPVPLREKILIPA